MKTIVRTRLAGVVLAAACVLAGCVTTTAQRIARNPGLFASFPDAARQRIREGRIEMGDTRDMVWMAIGTPGYKAARLTASGTNEVWTYTTLSSQPDSQYVAVPYYVQDRRGRTRVSQEWTWVRTDRTTEVPRLRVEFRDGKVVAIEEPLPRRPRHALRP